MTTKTKTKKVTVEPKTQPKVSTSEQKKSFNIPSFSNKIDKPSVYKLIKHGRNKKTGKPTYPVTYMVKAEDVIYDPETNTERAIRYVPGETSIYKDEQSKDSKLREPIMFSNGVLTVAKTNPTLKKFLDMCNANSSNPNRRTERVPSFFKEDTQVNAKKDVSKAKAEINALQLALNMPMEQLVGYAKVLGVNTDNSIDEIRWDMKLVAQKDPSSFIAGLNDPTREMKEVLLRAKEYRIIEMSNNEISWIIGDSKNRITHVPIGIKPMDKMVDFCLTQDGKVVYEEIKSRLSRLV